MSTAITLKARPVSIIFLCVAIYPEIRSQFTRTGSRVAHLTGITINCSPPSNFNDSMWRGNSARSSVQSTGHGINTENLKPRFYRPYSKHVRTIKISGNR